MLRKGTKKNEVKSKFFHVFWVHFSRIDFIGLFPLFSLILPIIFLLLGRILFPGAAVYINKNKLRNRFWQSPVSAAIPFASRLFALILAIPLWAGMFPSISPKKLVFLLVMVIQFRLFLLF